MPDNDFDLRLQRVLRGDAERAVRPFDAVAVAGAAMAAATVARRLDWRPAGWPAIRLVVVASLLLVAALATLWILSVGGRRQGIVEVVPSPSPIVEVAPLNVDLMGTWVAVPPADIAIGGGTPASDVGPFTLKVDDGGTYAYLPDDRNRERLPSFLSAPSPDELRFVTRSGVTDDVTLNGRTLGACAVGDEGTYRATRSSDGLRLTLEAVSDTCPSRPVVLARTWVRSLGDPSSGGIGVVDAFDPLFTVTLPPGSFTPDRALDAITLTQASPELQFIAWKDPQGFNDPCDPLGKGRRPIANAADFVAYFRELPGFTVDTVEDTTVDGHAATHLVLHADANASCPSGRLAQWQPKAINGEPFWFLRPGDSDSLYLVDLADTTLMFEVLAGPRDLDTQVIPSIRILEGGLPTSP